MPLPEFPATLPHGATADSLALAEPFQPPQVSDVEDGPPIVRKKAVTEIEKISMRLPPLTDAQFQTWKAFVRDTLAHGSSHFMMPVQVDGWLCDVRRVFLSFQDGSPAYQASGAPGRKWNVSFVLGVYPEGVT